MNKEQVNITSEYKGDFSEIEGIPTINGKRLGLGERIRFKNWRETNRRFMQRIASKFDVSAEYMVSKNDFLRKDTDTVECVSGNTKAHDNYILGGGRCYGGNVGDKVAFHLGVCFDETKPEVRIRKLKMTCRDENENVSFEMLFGGFDYDNSLDDFFADFVESSCYSLKKQ